MRPVSKLSSPRSSAARSMSSMEAIPLILPYHPPPAPLPFGLIQRAVGARLELLGSVRRGDGHQAAGGAEGTRVAVKAQRRAAQAVEDAAEGLAGRVGGELG